MECMQSATNGLQNCMVTYREDATTVHALQAIIDEITDFLSTTYIEARGSNINLTLGGTAGAAVVR